VLPAFDDLGAPDVLELLGRAPDPVSAARLSTAQITADDQLALPATGPAVGGGRRALWPRCAPRWPS